MASHPEFDDKTTATEVAATFSDEIKGKVVVVTGVSPASIGYTTALAIASQSPALLILASRTRAKLDQVASDIAERYPSTPVKVVLLDLASIESVRAAAAQIAAEAAGHGSGGVDVLINNAGVNPVERLPVRTPGGTVVDTQLMTNHLGVFLLTSLLLPQLTKAAAAKPEKKGDSRVVNLTSQGHRLSPVRFSDYAFERPLYDETLPEDERPAAGTIPPFFLSEVDGYPGFMGYGQSKSANILHAAELSRRLRKGDNTGSVIALSVHPGTIETELSRSLDESGRDTINKTAPKGLWKTQDQGSATTLVAAFDPKLGEAAIGESALGYMYDCQLRDDMVAPHASSLEAARRLWEESERMLQISVGL